MDLPSKYIEQPVIPFGMKCMLPEDDVSICAKLIKARREMEKQDLELEQKFTPQVALWKHLIHHHQGKMPPNGVFRKGQCEVKAVMHKKSHFCFVASAKCGIKDENGMSCASCKNVKDTMLFFVEEGNTGEDMILRIIAGSGFEFYGFHRSDTSSAVEAFPEHFCKCEYL
jgi:hypothetical protein